MPTRLRILLAVLLLGSVCAHADIVVVVSAKSAVTSLTQDQVADIFMGRAAAFPGGGAAVPVDQREGSPVRNDFYEAISGKALPQMKAYWARMLFTGRGQPPVEVGDSGEVKHLVAGNSKLIAYIDRAALDNSVKVVFTLH
ncbi:MAG: phosphate ABC transporter substrate-binding protein [Burkholderiales bacterium]|nr:phosphate ABC transporter substrate-binding protein [Burkholderiales bacterium]